MINALSPDPASVQQFEGKPVYFPEGPQVEQHDTILIVRTGDVFSLDVVQSEKSDSADDTINLAALPRERRAGRRMSA